MGGVHNHNHANKATFFIIDPILYSMPSWAGFIITTVPIRLDSLLPTSSYTLCDHRSGGVHNHYQANKATFFITDLILYTMPSWAGFIITTVPIRLHSLLPTSSYTLCDHRSGGVHNHYQANKATFFITDLILYTMPSWAGFIITTVPIRLHSLLPTSSYTPCRHGRGL